MTDPETSNPEPDPQVPVRPRSVGRIFAYAGVGLTALVAAGAIVLLVLLRLGVLDGYIRSELDRKLDEMGIRLAAGRFTVKPSPLTLEIDNAVLTNDATGERLARIGSLRVSMTILDLVSWRLKRNISIDAADAADAEVWVTFDKNGRSNFSGLRMFTPDPDSPVDFSLDSSRVTLSNGVIHFGDVSRSIAGDLSDLTLTLNAEPNAAGDSPKFKFDAYARNSWFEYDAKRISDITFRGRGLLDEKGAAFDELALSTPVGHSTLKGTISDWSSLVYSFDIESSLDLTQISNTFKTGASLRGVGNFRGRVTGAGENIKIDGEADAETLRADGIYLRGIGVNASGSVANGQYDATGKAVAELLTFDDVRIDFPRMSGNIRGTGTDFRWVGELQAAAVATGKLTFGGLFLADAAAEYRDRQLAASAGSGRTPRFAIGDTVFEELEARALRLSARNGSLNITSDSASSRAFVTEDYRFDQIRGSKVSVSNRGGVTEVKASGLSSGSGRIGQGKLKDVTARTFEFKDLPRSSTLRATDLRASSLNLGGTVVTGIESPLLSLESSGGTTVVYSDRNRIARLESDSAVLGSINVAGVRLTIRSGMIEGRSADIDAGDVAIKRTEGLPDGGVLEGVRINRPVFVVEPSGRYRASADMSIGGGMVGSVALGSARADVTVDGQRVELRGLNARVMEGSVAGNASIALTPRTRSEINADFRDLDLGRLLSLASTQVIPLEGRVSGAARLDLPGTDYRGVSGTLTADIDAAAGGLANGSIPIAGKVDLVSDNGLVDVRRADLRSEKSEIRAGGKLDLRANDSNLGLVLISDDANEIDRLVRVTGLSPTLESQLNDLKLAFAGPLRFDGRLTGSYSSPAIKGDAEIASVTMRDRTLGSVSALVDLAPEEFALRNGRLEQLGGGRANFTVIVPRSGANNTSVSAELFGINAGDLLAALPIEMPERIRDLNGKTSGTVKVDGLPDEANGRLDLSASGGRIAGRDFDSLKAAARFERTSILLDSGEITIGKGKLELSGRYDRATTDFSAELSGKAVPVPILLALLPPNDSLPAIDGTAVIKATASGRANEASSIVVDADGAASNVMIGDTLFGDVVFDSRTADGILTARLTADLPGGDGATVRKQVVTAALDLKDPDLRLTASTDFDNGPIEPFLAFIPQLKGLQITGEGSGRIDFGGPLMPARSDGSRTLSADQLSGTARFDSLSLKLQETPLAAAEPIRIRFSPREVNFDSAKFTGGGSNLTVIGTKALAADAVNDLTLVGKINLSLLNLTAKDTFFAGSADISVRLEGPNSRSDLRGSAASNNASIAAFIGSDRITFERVKARVVFSDEQAEVENATGYLGGGKFTGSGGILLDGLSVKAFRFTVLGDNVTVPLPRDFLTTGDARLEVTGVRPGPRENVQVTISGRVFARRSLYSKDIDLANVIGGRRERSLAPGASSIVAPRFDLVIEGKDALVVRNNIADLTASVSITLTGDANDPEIAGRVTTNGGTLIYRNDRYEIQRGVLDFPPDSSIDPLITLQAESTISGYQIFVNLNGRLSDTESLNVTVRSSPSLPSNDIISLMTTGALSNTAGGIPALAQTGIRTAAELLTDSVINNPARRATDKLFGLNVFEIDPIISGQQLNASARLTVGRQINNNLRVTYSTNLSQDQNQVIALEYRVSNKLSFVAQYEQRSLTNVTRTRDNFSFEVRFKKRF